MRGAEKKDKEVEKENNKAIQAEGSRANDRQEEQVKTKNKQR